MEIPGHRGLPGKIPPTPTTGDWAEDLGHTVGQDSPGDAEVLGPTVGQDSVVGFVCVYIFCKGTIILDDVSSNTSD